MKAKMLFHMIFVGAVLIVKASGANAQFIQQGTKLVGPGASSPANQGASVSLSADGNTAIVGGPNDDRLTGMGAAWVFVRSGGAWAPEAKLVGLGVTGAYGQGFSVALSKDGNTAAIGAPNGTGGAAYVFMRSGSTWTQQTALVGTGATSNAAQGISVGLSTDGNTAIVGGFQDNGNQGAAWVFTRSGGTWTQQAKLVGTGSVGSAWQGWAVAISGDGNTAIVGGFQDNGYQGAAWVFTRSGTAWTQQTKLVGTGAVGPAHQGYSVSVSADGNTALIGGNADSSSTGAVWVFVRSGSIWSQQAKLVGAGAIGAARQGFSVSLSADGNLAASGGIDDNGSVGASWIFARSGSTWTQLTKLIGSGNLGSSEQGYSTSLSADGRTAIFGGPNDNYSSGYATGAAWIFSNPAVPFSVFNPTLKVALGFRPDKDRFLLTSKFILGDSSDGVDPSKDTVALTIGPFKATIPAGSFKAKGPGLYTYLGVIAGVKLDAIFKATGSRSFAFEALGKNANLTGLKNPVSVTLTVGNDTGTATSNAGSLF